MSIDLKCLDCGEGSIKSSGSGASIKANGKPLHLANFGVLCAKCGARLVPVKCEKKREPKDV